MVRSNLGQHVSMRSFKDLRVWQEAFALALDVDRLARALPSERPDLADQIRRSSASVPRNIAEGHGDRSDRDFARYVVMAQGSLHELESDVTAIRVQSLAPGQIVADVEIRIAHVERLISGLLRRLRPPEP